MIIGSVNGGREPIVRLRVIGPNRTYLDVDAVVDTGCTSALVLPLNLASLLGLNRQGTESAYMADGSRTWFDTYDALVDWNGDVRHVTVSTFGPEPVIGMTLLDGCDLHVECSIGGRVEIRTP